MPRYVQEPGSGVAAYLPQLIEWKAFASDPKRPLLITEGELKAAKATLEGFPTVGLGGVYSFRSAKLGLTFLPELRAFTWVRREVYIVYDSDYRTNAQVCRALYELAETLRDEGAYPYVVTLPAVVENGKTGLDDFLVKERPSTLATHLREAEPLSLAASLWTLNQRAVFVRNHGLVIDLRTNQKMSPTTFRDAAYATEVHADRVLRPDGTVALKRTSGAAAWLRWPLRREVDNLTYQPGSDRFVERDGLTLYNTWPGWGVSRVEGEVKFFRQLVEHLFQRIGDCGAHLVPPLVAIINSMVAAETTVGINGNSVYALPHERIQEVLSKYNRLTLA